MVATAGTLSEYDMILSVSEKAINDQFLVLFYTPNPMSRSPNGEINNLIPNTMKLGYIVGYNSNTGKNEPSKVGVTATIDCPTVELTDIGSGDNPDRCLRLKIHMKTAKLTYIDPNFGGAADENLDGWTVSWIAQIGHKDIQNIEEEAIHPDAKKAIKTALSKVPSDDFLVSSLFCLFDNTTITNSFSLVDSNGKPAKDATSLSFLNIISLAYSEINHSKNPYVLGYTISQKIPKPLPDSVQAAFTPSMFNFSTTPYKDDKNHATLNFCMMSATNKNIKESLIDPAQNHSAGILTKPFVSETRATNLKSDGVFAISNTLLFQNWLKATILDRMDVGPDLAKKVTATSTDQKYEGGTGTTKASKTTSWNGDWIDPGPLKPNYQYSGYSKVEVEYRSVLQDQPKGEIPVSTTRSLTLDLTGEIYSKIEFHTFGYVDATTHWNAKLLVKSANDGTWSVERKIWNIPGGDPVKGDHIKLGAKILEFLELLFSGPGGVLNNMDLLVAQIAGAPEADFDTIGDAFKSVSNTVIMPCGDVYTFQGLDCDNSGNVYTYIKYKTIL